MRSRKTALPKSYSWLPGVKMSGATMLVSVTMLAPWSRLDISEGESVSPAWAKITLPPEAAARARSAFTTAASLGKPPRRLPSGISTSPIR